MSTQVRALQGKRVLIVEDNDLLAKFFRMALERAGGCSCVISEDVPTILEHVSAGEIDLVLLDVSLNNSEWEGHSINGVELCRMLKEKIAAALARAAGHGSCHERRSRKPARNIRRRWLS